MRPGALQVRRALSCPGFFSTPTAVQPPPDALRGPASRQQRRALLALPHMAPLAAYAARLRRPSVDVPDFDPLDGGTGARVLFLLEKPGPQAASSRDRGDTGFISRDNAGETPKALRRFMLDAGLPRRDTVIWNVIPWWNGSIAVTAAERAAGLLELPHALALLPRLHTAVLVGRTAARARPVLGGLRVLESAHPSPQVRAGNRALWDAIPEIWRQAAQPP